MSSPYWQKRFEGKEAKRDKENKVFAEELKRHYRNMIESMQKDILLFYERYAENKEITLAEAMIALEPQELLDKKEKITEYTKQVIAGDQTLANELDRIAAKARLSRLEGLKADMIMHTIALGCELESNITDHLQESFTKDYYETIFEIQKGAGVGGTFTRINHEMVTDALAYNWSGEHYSKRIWGNNTDKLAEHIKDELTSGLTRGDSVRKMANTIAKEMGKSYDKAVRLVNTEAAFVNNIASLKGYKETCVEQYEFLATLDMATSQKCRDKDGKIYDVKDGQTGVNLPPLHVNCRSTTVPYFEDDYTERVASANGEMYQVPPDIHFNEWYKEYVEKRFDNGLGNNNRKINVPKATLIHAMRGDFTNPKNPKVPQNVKLKSGGHMQESIDVLNSLGIVYNIVKEYDNGVRVGNIPSHKRKVKRDGINQSWFPEDWTINDVDDAAFYVANLQDKRKYVIEEADGVPGIFKYANYKGVTVCVCYDKTKHSVTTIFPDSIQRMIGGETDD